METILINRKSLLEKHKKSDYWFDYEYNLNLYSGANQDCIYCDGENEMIEFDPFAEIKIKLNAPSLLEIELSNKRIKGIIGLGAMTDPYNPFEKRYELTRKTLEILKKYEYGVIIITRSKLLERDLELLTQINQKEKVICVVKIACADNEMAKKVEPDASTPDERFRMIKALTDRNITTGVAFMPVLPFINDQEDNINKIIEKAKMSGASFVYPWFDIYLFPEKRRFYFHNLDKHFPGMKEKYQKTFGDEILCQSPDKERLIALIEAKCVKENIICNLEEINRLFDKKTDFEQLSLL
ncbi:MAG: hypothetical protein PHZ28_03875 [Candidatus Izemoplasmatales bacterium]|nr:hypothetical protein [Candidatus Izemoplasmatales bacterium]